MEAKKQRNKLKKKKQKKIYVQTPETVLADSSCSFGFAFKLNTKLV